MDRDERDKLVAEYHRAIKAYSDAVSRLIGLSGLEFEKAYKEVETLREICEQRRAELKRNK